jgi:hypothetical protein
LLLVAVQRQKRHGFAPKTSVARTALVRLTNRRMKETHGARRRPRTGIGAATGLQTPAEAPGIAFHALTITITTAVSIIFS